MHAILLALPLAIKRISDISTYVTLDLNVWHACLLAQAEAPAFSS